MREFNINDYVKVQLTPNGRGIHREYWNNLGICAIDYQPPEEDAEGWSKWQLWEVMEIFGPHVGMGGSLPFSTTIQL